MADGDGCRRRRRKNPKSSISLSACLLSTSGPEKIETKVNAEVFISRRPEKFSGTSGVREIKDGVRPVAAEIS